MSSQTLIPQKKRYSHFNVFLYAHPLVCSRIALKFGIPSVNRVLICFKWFSFFWLDVLSILQFPTSLVVDTTYILFHRRPYIFFLRVCGSQYFAMVNNSSIWNCILILPNIIHKIISYQCNVFDTYGTTVHSKPVAINKMTTKYFIMQNQSPIKI